MADEGKDKKGCCEKVGDGFSNFAKFLFNRETGQVMGRSGESWLKIGIFYLIFYGFLAAFFSAMLTVFLKTLENPEDGGAPKLTQFIENKPGLTYTDLGATLDVIRNNGTTDAVKNQYGEKISKILNNFKGDKLCEDSATGMPDPAKPCAFNTALLGATCGKGGNSSNYGLNDNKPCVYVRMNKVFNWVPDATPKAGNFLKLNCGEDKAVTVTPVGFHIGSFPFAGQKDFSLPLVAVQIDLTKTDVSKVVCYLEGPNIEVSDSSVAHRAYSKVEIL